MTKAIVLYYGNAMFTMALQYFIYGEMISKYDLVSFVSSMLGLVFLISGKSAPPELENNKLLPDTEFIGSFLAITAGFLGALSNVLAKSVSKELPPLSNALVVAAYIMILSPIITLYNGEGQGI
jgi:drug/metabolite transporter (DMT)-like permease